MQAKESAGQRTQAPPCPIGRAADVLGDRWTLLILRNATVGMTRFDEFRADLGIADNILSTRLGRLVDAGLLTKVPYRDNGRTRHEYRLTDAGADLLPVLHALAAWGQRHTEPGAAGRPDADHSPSLRTSHRRRPDLRPLRPARCTRPGGVAAPVALADPVPARRAGRVGQLSWS